MRKFYCSKCGIELVHTRKAIPKKGHILDLIDPHECEGFAVKESPDNKPTVLEVIEGLKDLGEPSLAQPEPDEPIEGPGDRRDSSILKSTAPAGVLKGLETSST